MPIPNTVVDLQDPYILYTFKDDAQSSDRRKPAAEVNLFNTLLNSSIYSPSVRPALDPNKSIKVEFQAELFSLDGIVRTNLD